MSDILIPFEQKVIRAARAFVTSAEPGVPEFDQLAQAVTAYDVALELAGELRGAQGRAADLKVRPISYTAGRT